MTRRLPIPLNGAALQADLSGALLWPERRLAVVSDLHFEKGSSFARTGRFLPPYDTGETLDRLAGLIDEIRPDTVICLGDSFHDRDAAGRMTERDRARLRGLVAGCDWIWIAGNHDPGHPEGLGGRMLGELALGPLVFRHEARPDAVGEVSGHYHPAAAVRVRGRRIRTRCFATNGNRLILPAFGAYAGGLNVLAPAYRPLLGERFSVCLIGQDRLFLLMSERLEGDPAHG